MDNNKPRRFTPQCYLSRLADKWNTHLDENHMGYFRHLWFATDIGLCIIWYGLKMIWHGILPCFGTSALKEIQDYATKKRHEPRWGAITNRRRTVKTVDRE